MASKGVLDRQRVAKAIVAAGRAHAEEVGERLAEILTPSLQEGETLPDMVQMQLLLARYLEERIAAIIRADELHLQELNDDQEPRRQRDAAADELYTTLIDIRDSLTAAFGSERASEMVGIEGRTAGDPVRLHRQAARALERLTDPETALPPPRIAGVQVELGTLAGQLLPALNRLARAIEVVDREQRETESTNLSKDNALDLFDAAVAGIGRIFIGCDELAGLPAFADKIRLTRPARRRSGPVSGDEETTEAPPPDPSGSEAEDPVQ